MPEERVHNHSYSSVQDSNGIEISLEKLGGLKMNQPISLPPTIKGLAFRNNTPESIAQGEKIQHETDEINLVSSREKAIFERLIQEEMDLELESPSLLSQSDEGLPTKTPV